MTDLLKAAKEGDVKRVGKLLKDDINREINDDEFGALMYISLVHNNFDIIFILLERSSGANTKGYTILMWASILGNFDIVSLLFERGADVNRKNIHGDTALMCIYACRKCYLNIEILLTTVQNLHSLDETSLEKLFQDDPYFWTRVSKHHSKKVFSSLVDKYSILLNIPRDTVQSIFQN